MNYSKARTAERSIGAILVDAGILSPQDAERVLQVQKSEGLRFGEAGVRIGVLTEADIVYALSLQFNYPFLPTGPNKPVSEEVVAAYKPFGVEGDQIRALRSQLQLRWFNAPGKRTALSIVSTSRGDGRSHLAANLAVSFAQVGERTLLIDADLRNPRQHQLFQLESGAGLSSLLAGRVHDRAISFIPGIPGLAVLPAGPTPPNPAELLGTTSLDRILEQSMATFDAVIIDTPAFELGDDSLLMTRFAGAALAVARSHRTRAKLFNNMIGALSDVGAPTIGTVLVDVPTAKAKSRLRHSA